MPLNSHSSMKKQKPKKTQKDSNGFWHRKLTLKLKFWHFLTVRHSYISPNSVISFDYSWFLAKNLSPLKTPQPVLPYGSLSQTIFPPILFINSKPRFIIYFPRILKKIYKMFLQFSVLFSKFKLLVYTLSHMYTQFCLFMM